MRQLVLLTGITGRTGKYFLESLANKGNHHNYKFRAIVREKSDLQWINKYGLDIELAKGDLNDINFLEHAMQGVDIILHISGIQRSLPLVETAVRNEVKSLILVHTTGIYSKYKKASSDYLEIEKRINELLAGRDISLTILRPTMIFGSLDDQNMSVFINLVDRFRLFPIVNGGKFALQPIHQRDLGHAYYQVLMNPEITANKNYILSGKDKIDLVDILKLISTNLGKKTHFIFFPFWLAYGLATILYFISFGKLDFREKVQRLVEPRAFSNEEAQKDFGFSPSSFAVGIQEEVRAYLEMKKSQ